MVCLLTTTIFFTTFFIQVIHAQITFTNPISSQTSCVSENMGDGYRLNCTGLGFVTADPMSLTSATTMYVTILSSDSIAAVGLGERVGGADAWCSTSDFPATGKTWASKSITRLSNCCYNMITMYTSSASTYAAVKPYQAAVVGNTYKWTFTPATKSYTCWQVDISMPYPDGSFTDYTDSPGFVCTSSKSFYYATNIILAPYFELEGTGTTSFYVQSSLCSAISDCISCPNATTCQFCRPGYQITDCGTCSNSTNLTCPVVIVPDESDDTDNEGDNTEEDGNSGEGENDNEEDNTAPGNDNEEDNDNTGSDDEEDDDGSSGDPNDDEGDDGSTGDDDEEDDDGGSGDPNDNEGGSDNEEDNNSPGNDNEQGDGSTGDDDEKDDDGSSGDPGDDEEDDGSSSDPNEDEGDDGSTGDPDDDEENGTGDTETDKNKNGTTITVVVSGTGEDYATRIIALVAAVIAGTVGCLALLFCKQIIGSISAKRNNGMKEKKNANKIYPGPSAPSQAELYPSIDLDAAKNSTQRDNTTTVAPSLTHIKEEEPLFSYSRRANLPRSRVFTKRPLTTIVDEVQEDLSVVVLANN